MSKLRYNYNRVQFTYRNNQLNDNGFSSYEDFLNSDFWKNLKNGLKNNSFYKKCCCCGLEEKINLHHIKYNDLFNASNTRYIFPLCENCHTKVHNLSREKNMSFKVAMRRIRKKNNYKMENRRKTPRLEKTPKHKYILSEGKICPKCRKPMQRRKHTEPPTDKSFYSEWDYCRPCGHIQHYQEFKVNI